MMLIAAVAAWLCDKARLPAIAGYLSAGFLAGSMMGGFETATEVSRMGALLQVGIVFVAFNIGQRVRWQRLRKVESSLALATFLTFVALLAAARTFGIMLGWPDAYVLVFGGMLIATSGALLEKCLRGANLRHHPFSHLAVSVNGVETVFSILLLVALVSMTQFGAAPGTAVLGAVAQTLAVVVTLTIGALLVVSHIVPKKAGTIPAEVRTLFVAGLLLAMVVVPDEFGFQSVLGALTLGALLGTLRGNESADRTMNGLCAAIVAAFCVAVGMRANVAHLAEIWPLLLGCSTVAVAARPLIVAGSLVIVGESLRDSVRAGLSVTAFGGLSLLIAVTAIEGGLVPDSFYTLAAGVSFVSSIAAPMLIGRGEVVAKWIESKQPLFVRHSAAVYHERMAAFKRRRHASRLITFAAPRLVQLGLLVLFSSGLLLFARPLYRLTEKWIGPDWPSPNSLPVVFWLGFGALLLPTLIALWRNFEALAMMVADAVVTGVHKRTLRPVIERMIKAAGALAIGVWLMALFPAGRFAWWGLLILAAGFTLFGLAFWRRLIRWHSRFEIALRTQVSRLHLPQLKPPLNGLARTNGDWNLHLAEIDVADGTNVARRPVAELPLRQSFACTIVGIERQGVLIPNPGAATVLYPNDRILLLGRSENLRQAERWLAAPVSAVS